MREMFFYSFNYVIYIVKYFFVGEADDGDVEIFEFCCAVDVTFMHFWVVMDAAIQFYNQIGFGTIEVGDKLLDRVLAAEVIAVELVIAQVLPEQFLCRGHILSQLFCSREYLRRGTLEDFSFAEVVFHSCDFLPLLAILPPPDLPQMGEESGECAVSEQVPRPWTPLSTWERGQGVREMTKFSTAFISLKDIVIYY